MRNKKTTLSLAAIGATAALTTTGIFAAQAADATETQDVRRSDFVAPLSDTRATGHIDFLKEGVHLWTEGTTSTDKVAEYFPVQKTLAEAVADGSDYQWDGTANQPGQQFVIDQDGSAETTDDRGILVYEKSYDGDWWLARSSAQSIKDEAPSTEGGSGSEWHGSPSAWSAALPDATVIYGGFSLGSGVKGDGVLEWLKYGDTKYVFTDEQVQTQSPAPTQTVTATPTTGQAPTEKNVTGSNEKTVDGRKVTIKMTSDAAPENSTEGDRLRWKIVVDGFASFYTAQGFSDRDLWATRFDANSGSHRVKVLKNGDQVRSFKVNTNR